MELEARQRHRLVQILRAVLIILLFVVTALAIVTDSAESTLGLKLSDWWWVAVILVVAFFAAVVGIDILTPRRKLSAISAILFGCFAGLIATVILGLLINLFVETYAIPPEYDRIVLTAKVVLGLGLCYIGITTVLQTQDDFRLVIPYVEFSRQYRAVRPLVVDSSALIDARILALAELGVMQAPFIVPEFVVRELQTLADSSDRLKRSRGRRGLDVLARLQQTPSIELTIDRSEVPGSDVDSQLLDLAERAPATIVTTDSGLVRVAQVRSVAVLNVHDLAEALRPTVVPGDRITVAVVRHGDHPGQGVGYLDDGTMVVVENGAHAVGRTESVLITSATTTAAGRLIFARVPNGEGAPAMREQDAPTEVDVATEEPPADAAGVDDSTSPPEHRPPPTGPFGPHRKKKAPPSSRNPRRG